jgi:hypothetical protein
MAFHMTEADFRAVSERCTKLAEECELLLEGFRDEREARMPPEIDSIQVRLRSLTDVVYSLSSIVGNLYYEMETRLPPASDKPADEV